MDIISESTLTNLGEIMHQNSAEGTSRDVFVNTETERLIIPTNEKGLEQEYVEEVKTDLSEQRRAGFRFLIKQRTKVLAGLSILISISIIAMVSNSFLSTTIPKGKSNIQEVSKTADVVAT